MIIQTTNSFYSLFTAAILTTLWNIEYYEIVQEGEANSKDFFICTSHYTLENMIHEYERRFSTKNLWSLVQDSLVPYHIEAYLRAYGTSSGRLQKVIADLQELLKGSDTEKAVQYFAGKYTQQQEMPIVSVLATIQQTYKKILTTS